MNGSESKGERLKIKLISRLNKEATQTDKEAPSIPGALEFRREQYGLSKREFASILGIGYTHYSEVLTGRRNLSFKASRRAFNIGVPAHVLLQHP